MYDTDGTYISGCALQPGEYNCVGHDFIWSGQWNGYFFLYRTEHGDRLMFWDVSVKVDSEPLIFATERLQEKVADLRRLEYYFGREQVQSIVERSKTLKWAEQANKFPKQTFEMSR